jgi:hypothetical protein
MQRVHLWRPAHDGVLFKFPGARAHPNSAATAPPSMPPAPHRGYCSFHRMLIVASGLVPRQRHRMHALQASCLAQPS